jgi:hypothetical protein
MSVVDTAAAQRAAADAVASALSPLLDAQSAQMSNARAAQQRLAQALERLAAGAFVGAFLSAARQRAKLLTSYNF